MRPNAPVPLRTQAHGLSFCELDYVVVPFLAEFVNTLTNLAYGESSNGSTAGQKPTEPRHQYTGPSGGPTRDDTTSCPPA